MTRPAMALATSSTDRFRTHIDEVVAYLDRQSNATDNPGAVPLNCPDGDEDQSGQQGSREHRSLTLGNAVVPTSSEASY